MPKWKPGESGNPKGRPPKNRALTEILRRKGSRTYEDVDGRRRSGKHVVARLLWEAAATGQVEFPDGRVLTLTFRQWRDIAEYLYGQIDGPPPKAVDVTTAGEQIGQQDIIFWQLVEDESEELDSE